MGECECSHVTPLTQSIFMLFYIYFCGGSTPSLEKERGFIEIAVMMIIMT